MILVVNQSDALRDWVSQRIEHTEPRDYDPCEAIGVSDGERLLAAALYHDWSPRDGTIQMSIAADSPRWATRGVIWRLLHYPFWQLGVGKVWASIAADNPRALRFVQGIGFSEEARLQRHFVGRDVVICAMMRETWEEKWDNGQEIRAVAA